VVQVELVVLPLKHLEAEEDLEERGDHPSERQEVVEDLEEPVVLP